VNVVPSYAVSFVESKILSLALLIVGVGLIHIGVSGGMAELESFYKLLKTDSFVLIMALDFVLFCLFFPYFMSLVSDSVWFLNLLYII
jgi:hypothetical protein